MAGLDKANFFTEDVEFKQQREFAASWITTCVDLNAEHLVPVIVRKLTERPQAAEGENGADIMPSRARRVLLPLILLLADTIKARAEDRPIPDLDTLCTTALTGFLDYAEAHAEGIQPLDVERMVQVAVLTGAGEELLTRRVVSRDITSKVVLTHSPATYPAWRRLISQAL